MNCSDLLCFCLLVNLRSTILLSQNLSPPKPLDRANVTSKKAYVNSSEPPEPPDPPNSYGPPSLSKNNPSALSSLVSISLLAPPHYAFASPLANAQMDRSISGGSLLTVLQATYDVLPLAKDVKNHTLQPCCCAYLIHWCILVQVFFGDTYFVYVRLFPTICRPRFSLVMECLVFHRFGLCALILLSHVPTCHRYVRYERNGELASSICLICELAACASSGVTRTLLPGKSGSISLSIASLRFYTAVCRSSSFLFKSVGSGVLIFEVHLIEALSLALISFVIDGNVFYTVLVPRELGLLAPNRSDYSFMEVTYTLSFSLVLSDCIVGRKVLESSLLFAEVLTFKIARNIFLHQVSHTPRFVPLVLIAETITIKAAFIAASTIEIRHLNVFMDSLSLVKFLKSRDFVNEPESTLHDIRCLLESFSSIFIVYVLCTANVLAESLSLFFLLNFNIFSMVGV